MNNKNGKWLLAVAALCCLAPAALAKPDNVCPTARCAQVPEGGSTAFYLLGAGITCFGAMFLRSRLAKPTQS